MLLQNSASIESPFLSMLLQSSALIESPFSANVGANQSFNRKSFSYQCWCVESPFSVNVGAKQRFNRTSLFTANVSAVLQQKVPFLQMLVQSSDSIQSLFSTNVGATQCFTRKSLFC